MENTECDVINMENTESDVCQREIWKTVRALISIRIKYYVMCCKYANFNKQIQIQYKPIDALLCFRCKIDLYNRGYKADFFVP